MREQNEKIKQRRLVCRSCIRPASAQCLTPNVRMLRQTRTRSNRLRQRNDSDRHTCERYRKRLIAHASKLLGENWTGFRVENGIPTRNQRGGQRLKSLRHPRRSQLHRPIVEIRVRMPKPHRPHQLRNRVRTRNADEGAEGVEEVEEAAGEEGGATTEPRRLPSRKSRRDSD